MVWICTNTEFRLIRNMLFRPWVGPLEWSIERRARPALTLRPISVRWSQHCDQIDGARLSQRDRAVKSAVSLFLHLMAFLRASLEAMLVSASGRLSACATTERKDCGSVFESADYADYAEKEGQTLEQDARRGTQAARSAYRKEHRSTHLIVSAPALALNLCNRRNLRMQTF